MRTQKALLGKIVGGWQLAGITIFESGVPYSVANGRRLRWIGGANRADLNPAGKAGVRAQWSGLGDESYSAMSIRTCSMPRQGGILFRRRIDPKEARYIGFPRIGTAGFTPVRATPGRNTERVPGINNLNVNLHEERSSHRAIRDRIPTEFYNIWNHPAVRISTASEFIRTDGEGTIASSVQTSTCRPVR